MAVQSPAVCVHFLTTENNQGLTGMTILPWRVQLCLCLQ